MVQLHGFGYVEATQKAKAALEIVKLTYAMERPMRNYSLGMRQRAKIAQAIAHEPELLILDEPFNGLDPVGRFEMSTLLKTWAGKGKSLILASHILHEVEAVNPSFLLISGGRLLASGSPEEVRSILEDAPYTLTIKSSAPKRLASLLLTQFEIESLEFENEKTFQISTRSAAKLFNELPSLLDENDITVTEMSSSDDSLKTLFSTLMKMHRGELSQRGCSMNHWITGALATCGFELRRSFTIQRTSVSLVLALFPPTILAILIMASVFSGSNQARMVIADLSKLLTIFLVALVCLLTALLWATPNVYAEVEGKSWSFVASRPGGRVSIFMGKFLASFLVSFAISLIAISLCVLISVRSFGLQNPQQLWISMASVFLFGCMVYSAIFSMIGTLFIKRAMVVAAGYLFASDIVLASVPGAIVNLLTVRFHLQELGIAWIGWFIPEAQEEEYRMVFADTLPTWGHVVVLILFTAVALGIGCWVIVNREFITQDDS